MNNFLTFHAEATPDGVNIMYRSNDARYTLIICCRLYVPGMKRHTNILSSGWRTLSKSLMKNRPWQS